MEVHKTRLDTRVAHLISDRVDDALTDISANLCEIQEARDAWLKERLSAEDFEEYRRRMYFGPAGDRFPSGWVHAEIRVEIAKLEAAYRQGVQDGAQMMAMLLGLIPLPQLPLK